MAPALRSSVIEAMMSMIKSAIWFAVSGVGRADEDEWRLGQTTDRQQRAEVGVMRDDDAVLVESPVEDHLVRCVLLAEGPYRDGVVAGGADQVGDDW
jgi:hypothetical protein